MENLVNHQVRLAARPIGLPKTSDWSFSEETVEAPASGEVVVKTHYISVDPTMRGWMNDQAGYLPKLELGDLMRALTVGEVIASEDGDFAVGDFVAGVGGVQEYATLNGNELAKVDVGVAPLQAYLNTLGIAGLTAYCGLMKLAEPGPGKTVLVSGAAGSVGMHAGQIAKIKGCRVVGVAGGQRKCNYIVNDLGFDEAIDYKTENLAQAVRRTCPDGIDIFFDNVGGEILDAALMRLSMHARIILCGSIANYNATAPVAGPAYYNMLIIRRARMEGYIYLDYRDEWPVMIKEMAGWMASGQISCPDHIIEGGIGAFPDTLPKLFNGENLGKLMIKVA